MNFKSAVKYLDQIDEIDRCSKEHLLKTFQKYIGKQSKKKQISQLGNRPALLLITRLYELMMTTTNEQLNTELFCQLMQIISDHHQDFIQLFKTNTTLDYQFIKIVVTYIKGWVQLGQYKMLSNILESFENVPDLLNRKQFFMLYLGTFQLWISYVCEQKLEIALGAFPVIVDRLAVIQKKFVQVKDEFQIVSQMFKIASLLILFQYENKLNLPQNLSLYLKKRIMKQEKLQQIHIQKPKVTQCKIRNNFYEVMKRYILLDPDFRIILVRYIKQFAENDFQWELIDEHLTVINSLLKKQIMPNYNGQILIQLTKMQQNLEYSASDILSRLMNKLLFQIFENSLNIREFLTKRKNQLIFLGRNRSLRSTVFLIFYNFFQRKQETDKQIIDFLVLWNLEQNFIDKQNFMNFIQNKGFNILSQTTLNAVQSNNSILANQIILRNLEIKCEKMQAQEKQQFMVRQMLGKNVIPYTISTNLLLKMLIKNSSDINIINISKIMLTSNHQKIATAKAESIILFKAAMKNKIKSIEFFKNIILLNSCLQQHKIFGINMPSVLQYYAFIAKSLTIEDIFAFMDCLVNIFRITGSKISLLMLFMCLIYSGNSIENPQAFIIEILQRVFKEHETTTYHKIISYTHYALQSVIILSQIWANCDKIFQICCKFLVSWSLILSKAEIEFILYQYDERLYESILDALGIGLPILKYNRQTVVMKTLELINQLLNAPYSRENQYLSSFQNQIEIIPIRSKSQSNNIEIKLIMTANFNKNCQSFVDLYSSPEGQTNEKNIIIQNKHRICFNQGRLIYKDRISKKILFTSTILPVSRMVEIKIVIVQMKIQIIIDEVTAHQSTFQSLIDSIKIQLNGDLLIKELSWVIFDNEERSLDTSSTYHIYPMEAQVRMTKKSTIKMIQFRKKLSHHCLIAILLQLLKNNWKFLNISHFYQACFRLILKTDYSSKNYEKSTEKYDDQQQEINIYNFLFRKIRQRMGNQLANINLLLNISPQAKSKKIFFSLFTAAVFNQQFFTIISLKDRLFIVDFTVNLLAENTKFREMYENQSTLLFTKTLLICEKLQYEDTQNTLTDKLLKLLQAILLKHQPNRFLLAKINHFFYICKSTQMQSIHKSFQEFILLFFDFTSVYRESQEGTICVLDYVINQLKEFDILFEAFPIEIKNKVLDYLLSHQHINKCKKIISFVLDEQYLELAHWILCSTKRYMFIYFQEKTKTNKNFLLLQFMIESVIRLYIISKGKEQEQEYIKIITTFLRQLGNQLKLKQSYEKIHICTKKYFIFLIIYAIEKIQQSDGKIILEEQMVKNCFKIIFGSQKNIILKSLILIRKASTSTNIFKYIIKMEEIMTISVYAMNAFLQYIYEVLIVAWRNLPQDSLQLAQLEEQIHIYLQCLCKNYSTIKQKDEISNPLLYCYPKMLNHEDYQDKKFLANKLQEISKSQFQQLQGGIYFKLIAIVINLIEIFRKKNYSHFIEFLLQKICIPIKKNIKKEATFRVVTDFSFSKDIKQRSIIQSSINQIAMSHEEYYLCEDNTLPKNLDRIHSMNQTGEIKQNYENDLTPFYPDYFLMRICNYLQVMGDQTDQEILSNLRNYSQLFLKYLREFEFIYDEMNEKNSQFPIQYQEIEDLLELMKIQEDATISDVMHSPIASPMSRMMSPNRKYSNIIDAEQQNWANFDDQFFTPPMKKKRTLTIDMSSNKKKKADLINNLQVNIVNYSKQARNKKLHRFFRNQSKIILIKQLLHGCFTVLSIAENVSGFQPDRKKMLKFLNQYEKKNTIQLTELEIKKIKKDLKKLEIRRVYPYTAHQRPILKLKNIFLPNLANPALKQGKKGKYSQKIHAIPENNFSIFDDKSVMFNSLAENKNPALIIPTYVEETVCVVEDSKEELMENICQISFRKGIYFCDYAFLGDRIIFTTKSEKQPPSDKFQRIIKFGAPTSSIITTKNKKIQLIIGDILEIFYRKFNQIANSALQFFFSNGSSYMIILYTQKRTDEFIRSCKNLFPQFRDITIIKDCIKQFEHRNYAEKWTNGQITNFDYLMLVNKFSGRSLIDLNQYFIFPWILQDYTSKQLDLRDHKIYRDLSKPIGALNQQRLERYKQKMNQTTTQKGPSYLYGSHYSTSLFILHYLVRLQPFTSLHCDMQSGDFDSPDRIFSSMSQMWECLTSQSSNTDIKESIPQFYYMPAFLTNHNNLDMGRKHCGKKVENVELPPWALSPTHFINIMRACLQSDYVSANLNLWIDLIFGKDQYSVQKNNVFHPLAYSANINLSTIQTRDLEGIMAQIFYYGQNPNPLFLKEHSRKKVKIPNEISRNSLQKITKNLRFQEQLSIGLYIGRVICKDTNVTLRIYEINKQNEAYRIHLQMQNSLQSIMRSFQQKKQTKFSKLQSLTSISSINVAENNKKISAQVNCAQIIFKFDYLGNYKQEKFATLKLLYQFEKAVFNETIIITFGSCGLRIYNWNLQMVKQICEHGDIVEVYLEFSYLFYLTSTGSLFFYDLVTLQKEQICKIKENKPTKKAQMLVFPECKKISKKSEFSYKFLLIGDLRQIVLFSYTHSLYRKQ